MAPPGHNEWAYRYHHKTDKMSPITSSCQFRVDKFKDQSDQLARPHTLCTSYLSDIIIRVIVTTYGSVMFTMTTWHSQRDGWVLYLPLYQQYRKTPQCGALEHIVSNISYISFHPHPHPLEKTAVILANDIFKYIFLNENDRIPVQISSVCPTFTHFSLCSRHRIIIKFSGVNTKDWSEVHAKGQDQRSKVKVTVVETLFSRFRTITPG